MKASSLLYSLPRTFFVLFFVLIIPVFLVSCGKESGKSPDTTSETTKQKPDKTITLTERGWKYFPDKFTVRQGQLVKVTMKASDKGIGAGHGFAIEGMEREVFLNGVLPNNPKSVMFRVEVDPGKYRFYCATQCSTDKRHTNMEGTMVVKQPSN